MLNLFIPVMLVAISCIDLLAGFTYRADQSVSKYKHKAIKPNLRSADSLFHQDMVFRRTYETGNHYCIRNNSQLVKPK